MPTAIQTLTKHPLIFKGNEHTGTQDTGRRIAFGHPHLDKACAGGAPETGMIRLRALPGSAELRLIEPLIVKRAATRKRIIWLQTELFMSPQWLSERTYARQCWIVRCTSPTDTFWTCEQAIRSQACACLVLYYDRFPHKAARRLQVLAKQYDCLVIAISRPLKNTETLAINMDFELFFNQSGWQINLYKIAGTWPQQNIPIDNPLPASNDAIIRAFTQYAAGNIDALHNVG